VRNFSGRGATPDPPSVDSCETSASAWFPKSVKDVSYARFYGADNEATAGCDDEESALVSGFIPSTGYGGAGRNTRILSTQMRARAFYREAFREHLLDDLLPLSGWLPPLRGRVHIAGNENLLPW